MLECFSQMDKRDYSFRIYKRQGFLFATCGILIALTLGCGLLRFYRLNDLPPGLHFDEAVNGINALLVLQGKHSVFFPESTGREGMVVYLAALSVARFGRTVLALRLPLAIASASTVLAVFWLGRVLFEQDIEGLRYSPWRGLMVGAVGAGLMAVSIGQTFMGRMAFRANLLPLFLTEFGIPLARVEAAQVVAHCVGWYRDGIDSVHIYPGALRTILTTILWPQLFSSSWPWFEGKNPN